MRRFFLYRFVHLLVVFPCCFQGLHGQSANINEIAHFTWDYHVDAVRYANQFIDAAIRGEYQEKFFSRNKVITQEKFLALIPDSLHELEPKGIYRTSGGGLTRKFFPEEKKERLLENVLVTTRINSRTNKPVLVAIKFRFRLSKGLYVHDFSFLSEESEELITWKENMECSLLYYLTGEGPSNGCMWLGSQPVPPPPPPSLSLLTEEEKSRKRHETKELTVLNGIQLEEIHLYPNLEKLTIDCWYCTDFPQSIVNMTQLKELSINAAQLYGMPNDFTKLDSLKKLHIRSAWNIPEIRGLEELEELSLNLVYNQYLPEFIFELQSLKILSFEEMNDLTLLESFEGKTMNSIEELQIKSAILPPLHTFPGLKRINLHGKGFEQYKYQDDALSIPVSLEKVAIFDARSTLPEWIFMIPNLKELNLTCGASTYGVPDNLDKLNLEILRFIGRQYQKLITQEILAPLRAKEGLTIIKPN